MTRRWLPLALAVLACLPLLGALGAGFQLDDHFQRLTMLGLGGRPWLSLFVFYDGDPAKNLAMMDQGWLPWWTAPELRHASLRYLSVLSMRLDYLLWPSRPELMHLHSLVWLGALVAAATAFYRRVLGVTWVAALAALLYALDDAHAAPAEYLANRNALIASCFGVAALACFARGRGLAAAGCLALALAAGEIALGAVAYLVAYALCLERGRARAFAPSAAVLVVWALVYELGRFGAQASGFYVDPVGQPLEFARAFVDRAPFLILGQWTPVPADFGVVESVASQLRWLALATVLAVTALFAPLVRREPVARFFALGAVLSLVPIAATGPGNRLLFFVGLGSMGLVAQLVHRAVSQRWLWLAAAPLLAVHVVLAPALSIATLRFQHGASAKLDGAIASVPADESLREQDLILVNPPDYVYLASAIPAVRAVEGRPRASRMRALAPGPMELTRTGERTLRVRLTRGLFPDEFSRYFRSPELPFAVGQRVELTGFAVEILALHEAGDPSEFEFGFPVPLEDESLRWLRYEAGEWRPWIPPALGESAVLQEESGIFG